MKLFFVSAAASLLTGTVARAETWHVAVTGDNAAAGTSAAPWRTIQRAADAVAPGDTVVIHAGSYIGFTVDARGTEAAPIAFVGDGDVVIQGSMTAHRDAVFIDGGAWIRIEGLTVIGATRAGISAENCEHITVRGNRLDSNGRWGVFSSFCDDLVVEGNEASRSRTEHGIYASNSADRPVIRNNRIWGNGMCGIHMNGDINYGGDGVISNAVVEDNIIFDNGVRGGSAINGDGVVGAVIRNNVLDRNHGSGISLYRIDGGAASTGNQLVNNTVRMASDGRWAVNIQDGSRGNVLRNNILLHPAAGRGAIDLCATCATGMISDGNAVVGRFMVGGVVVNLAGWRARTGTDAASFTATDGELFTNAAGGDLTLRAGSPAVDRGITDGAPSTDVLGTPRPQGTAVDIGAYERCEGPCVGGEPDGGTPEGSGDGSREESDEDDAGGEPGDDGTEEPAPGSDVDAGGCTTSRPGSWPVLALGFVVLGLRCRRR